MAADFAGIFAELKLLLAAHAKRLTVKVDSPTEYSLVTKAPSPFPQHKGSRMNFGSVLIGKAYVSFHLMPIYMDEELSNRVSPALKKRMQGKSCFNFKANPDPALLKELKALVQASVDEWRERNWA